MTKFLADYGLKWVGNDGTSVPTTGPSGIKNPPHKGEFNAAAIN